MGNPGPASVSMAQRSWSRIRGVGAVAGLVLPLTTAWLTPQRWVVLGSLLLIMTTGWLLRRRLARAWTAAATLYLLSCLALLIGSLPVLQAIGNRVVERGAAVALVLAILLWLDARYPAWRQRLAPKHPAIGDIGGDLLLLAASALVVRASVQGLWTNAGWGAALLLLAPPLHLRAPRIASLLWLLTASLVLFEWYGFMNMGQDIGTVTPRPPAGITVSVLHHGNPAGMPGARFFRPAQCAQSSGAFYMGEGNRTYRLNADGSETSFIEGLESAQTLIERCELGEVITASFEGKLLRFARLDDGRVLRDVALPSHPATMLLADDGQTLYVSTSMPAGLVEIDLRTRKITRVLDRYFDRDPGFSGVVNLAQVGERIVGAFASWYTIGPAQGELFSVDRHLGDHRAHAHFAGAWAYLLPDPTAPGQLLLNAYYTEPLLRVDLAGHSEVLTHLSAGSFYMATVPGRDILVANHWTTGDVTVLCLRHPEKRYEVALGGMGRMLNVQGNRIYTPTAAGYVTLTLPEDLCR